MNSIWKPFIIPLFIDSHNLHYGISEMGICVEISAAESQFS